MINADLEQFLDTGWFSEAEIRYKGYICWCEAQTDFETDITTFFVDRWEAINQDNTLYHSILEDDGTLVRKRIIEIKDKDFDLIKNQFFKAPIFDGKSFREAEPELAWLEDGGNIYRKDMK